MRKNERMRFAKFISANSWYSCFSFCTTILRKNNNSFIHRLSRYFPSSHQFDIHSCIYFSDCGTNTAFVIFLPCLSLVLSQPPDRTEVNVSPIPSTFAGESSPSFTIPAVLHSQFTHTHRPSTPQWGERKAQFQYRYRNIGGCQIHIEHFYEKISRPTTSRSHRQYSFPNECNMNRQICLFFFHIFFFINNGATLPLRSQPWRRVTDFSDLFNFLSLLLSFLFYSIFLTFSFSFLYNIFGSFLCIIFNKYFSFRAFIQIMKNEMNWRKISYFRRWIAKYYSEKFPLFLLLFYIIFIFHFIEWNKWRKTGRKIDENENKWENYN